MFNILLRFILAVIGLKVFVFKKLESLASGAALTDDEIAQLKEKLSVLEDLTFPQA